MLAGTNLLRSYPQEFGVAVAGLMHNLMQPAASSGGCADSPSDATLLEYLHNFWREPIPDFWEDVGALGLERGLGCSSPCRSLFLLIGPQLSLYIMYGWHVNGSVNVLCLLVLSVSDSRPRPTFLLYLFIFALHSLRILQRKPLAQLIVLSIALICYLIQYKSWRKLM